MSKTNLCWPVFINSLFWGRCLQLVTISFPGRALLLNQASPGVDRYVHLRISPFSIVLPTLWDLPSIPEPNLVRTLGGISPNQNLSSHY